MRNVSRSRTVIAGSGTPQLWRRGLPLGRRHDVDVGVKARGVGQPPQERGGTTRPSIVGSFKR